MKKKPASKAEKVSMQVVRAASSWFMFPRDKSSSVLVLIRPARKACLARML